MEYVMVPVPEELAAEVEVFVRQTSVKAAADTLDEDDAACLLRDLDDRSRAFLLQAARAADERAPLTVGDAAGALGCSSHEIVGILVELNNTILTAGGPHLTLLPIFRGESESWPLTMVRNLAQLFLAADAESTITGDVT
jgi:hypothetical protein